MNLLSVFTLIVGIWMTGNGILHDIFVLMSEHGKKYDRDLLRLLMDGHVLITCGVIQLVSVIGLRNNETWSYYIAGIACISALVYCAMIFPFLKSLVTITLNTVLLILLVINFVKQ